MGLADPRWEFWVLSGQCVYSILILLVSLKIHKGDLPAPPQHCLQNELEIQQW